MINWPGWERLAAGREKPSWVGVIARYPDGRVEAVRMNVEGPPELRSRPCPAPGGARDEGYYCEIVLPAMWLEPWAEGAAAALAAGRGVVEAT